MSVDRREILEAYGAFYGARAVALCFTETNRVNRPGKDPKRVVTPGWQHTQPLPHAEAGVGLLTSRGQYANPAINLRTSGLVGVESDGSPDLAQVEELGLPETLTERSSLPSKLHFYFRPPPELETLVYVSFRFEGGRLTGAKNNYYVCAPALHPSGAVYAHLPGPGLSDVEIATMPAPIYQELAQRAGDDDARLREQIANDPDLKVSEGHRRKAIFKYACMLRRWTTDREEILEAAHRWNELHCEPPVARLLVSRQVDGAMEKAGGQDLRKFGS